MNLLAVLPIKDSIGTIPPGQSFIAGDERGRKLISRGQARLDTGPAPWAGLTWPQSEVVILGSGPSLDDDQCEAVRRWRGGARRVIAINNTFRKAPWADVLYACDEPWWLVHHVDVKQMFHGEQWSQDERAIRFGGIKHIESQRLPGLGKRPGIIHQGGNGGYQAINLAYQAGARRIILLGFDMKGTHWHGKHVGLPNTPDWLFERWKENFVVLAKDLKEEGVEVINCSPGTALQAFEKQELAPVLGEETTRESNLQDSEGSSLSAACV